MEDQLTIRQPGELSRAQRKSHAHATQTIGDRADFRINRIRGRKHFRIFPEV